MGQACIVQQARHCDACHSVKQRCCVQYTALSGFARSYASWFLQAESCKLHPAE
jgi:hypothetical protein